MPIYTAEQRAALSFAALDRADADWRHGIDRRRLSFTDPGWDPLTQLFGSVAAGMAKLHLAPGSAAALGFAALTRPDGSVNTEDARRLRNQWRIFLPAPDDDS